MYILCLRDLCELPTPHSPVHWRCGILPKLIGPSAGQSLERDSRPVSEEVNSPFLTVLRTNLLI